MPSSQARVAVIDIGSNSIRLVIYDHARRSPAALYNEKVMCQLGRGLALSGKLNPEGVMMAEAALARYLSLVKVMEATELHVIATAAVRDASDGEAFTKRLEKTHGIHIDIISGKREAKLGAYGVMSSMHAPRGIVGDLGGGSMELVAIDGETIDEHVSLGIGPLRLIDTYPDAQAIETAVHDELSAQPWLGSSQAEHFYAIGGNFRALAKIHMEMEQYPLKILHEYSVRPKALLQFLKQFLMLSDAERLKLPGMAAKRLDALPAAAVVLKQAVEIIRPKQVVFSASGIREGFLYERLSPFVRREDVLIAACTDFASKLGRNIEFANELLDWTTPHMGHETEAQTRLRAAFCLLYDVARYTHPEYRAPWSYVRILESGFQGMSHEERVTLALALYHRHRFKLKEKLDGLNLIDRPTKQWARLAGTLANLAYHLTGGMSGTLPQIKLTLGKRAELTLPKHLKPLMGEAVERRLQEVQEAYTDFCN